MQPTYFVFFIKSNYKVIERCYQHKFSNIQIIKMCGANSTNPEFLPDKYIPVIKIACFFTQS